MTTPAMTPKTDGRETRAHLEKLEIRELSTGKDGRTVRGYAAVFNSETDICGYWVEKIAPGAFTDTLANDDVLALYSHREDRVLGRKSSGTLRLEQDDKGLAIEIDLPDTNDGRDLAVLIERGDIKGMSFGFTTRKQTWDETVEPPHRTIEEVMLYEVTITAFPQYDDTELSMRSKALLEGFRAERSSHNRSAAANRIAARRARQAQIERGIR